MEYMYNKLIEKNKYKKLLCIGTEPLNVNNSFPKVMKNFIFKALSKNERVIVFTDDILYKDIEKLFYDCPDFIIESLNKGILSIKSYDIVGFNFNCEEFLEILSLTAKTKRKLWVVWDFKNIARKLGKLDIIKKYVEDIFSYSNDKVSNLIYINNSNYSTENYKSLCSKFDVIVIKDKKYEMDFRCNEELDKAIWGLQSSAQLKYENSTLVFFNDMFANIPKTLDKDEFKDIIMKKLKDICDADFCIMFNSNKEKNNILSLDSYYGLTKKHKYQMVNNKYIIQYQLRFNESINDDVKSILINTDEIENVNIKKYLEEVSIQSYIGVFVEYYDIVKGVIWVGRYSNNKQISKTDIEYIESICKTAFYLIQEQNRFVDLQNKLIENEKLRAMGEMAAGIAHDINNILTPIIGSIQLLKDNINDKDVLRQLKIIEICAYDGMNITNKVKKITKQYNNTDKLEVFDVDELLNDAIDLTKNKWLTESAVNGIKINVLKSLTSKSKVKGNPTELREVFINIIRNAIDSMPNGGSIEISSERVDKKVNIQIRDNGIGMNEEVIKRVFEPFFTTKGSKGSGLGLSVSYKIIQSHEGAIKIDSKENVGTSFKIDLPVCESNNKFKPKQQEHQIEFDGSILIIDDQQQIRNVMCDMIKSLVKCRIKSCGCEDIENEVNRRKYDIIICDFSMPNMDGIEVANMVKKLNNDCYFCLMTGWIGNFDKNKIKNINFILNKPISKEKIIELFMHYKNMID